MTLKSSSVCFVAIGLALSAPCHAGKIHDAVAKRDLTTLAKALKEEPGHINSRCYPEFKTPLSMAVGIGDPAMVKALLDAGAKISTRDIGASPVSPVERAAIAPFVIPIVGPTPGDLRNRLQELRNQHAEVRAKLSNAEKAARLEVLELLLAKKPELNKGLHNATPPLHLAVMTGNTERIKLLVRSGANVNTRSDLWFTPLHMAAIYNVDRDIIEDLIQSGADLEACEKVGNTPLYLAARNGSKTGVETLLSHGAAADAEGEHQIPVIGAAGLAGRDDIVKLIYEKGGPDLIRYAKKEILFKCAAVGGGTALIEILLSGGVDINIRDADGFSPLLTANEFGHWELSEFLIHKGADRKAKTNDGRCLFDIVCQAGNTALAKKMLEADGWPQGSSNLLSKIILAGRVDILRLLAERKVDIFEIGPTFSESGISALELAIRGRDISIENSVRTGERMVAAEEDYASLVELLLEHGANPNQFNSNGYTAVHIAAKGCGSRVMDALLKAGGKVAPSGSNAKETPLQLAAMFGRPETVRALLDAGADRNIRDSEGHNLLHLAAMHANPETLKLLIAEKLPLNAKTNDKTTPLHCAVVANSLESFRLLLAAGAAPDAVDGRGSTALAFAVNLQKTSEVFKKSNLRVQVMISDLQSRMSIIHLLLEAGVSTDMAFIDAATGKETDLLGFAANNSTPEIVELLKNPPPVIKKPRKP